MLFHCDSYFSIGSTHHVCQDYALTGQNENGCFAIVADGCSSSPHTDIGARLLCRTVAIELQKHGKPTEDLLLRSGEQAKNMAKALLLPTAALDATLLVAYADKQGQVDIYIVGDGSFCIKDGNGDLSGVEISYSDNMPAYLNYHLDKQALDCYLSHQASFEVSHLFQQKPTVVGTGAGFHHFSYAKGEVQQLFLSSDGVSSFCDSHNERIDTQPIWQQFTNIKSKGGAFITRRMRRFLHKTCPKNGWKHLDDVSVGSILIEGKHESLC